MSKKEETVVKKFLSKILPEDVGGKPDTVVCVLGNGLKVEACLADYSDQIKHRLMLHGLSQKLGDSASSMSKDRNFAGAFSAIQSVADNLAAGVWASRASSGTSDLVAALADLRGVELEAAQAAVDKMDEEQLALVKKHPAVKEAIARIQAERAKAAAAGAEDLGDMLKGIGL